MRPSLNWIRWAVLAASAAMISWQLFVPPIIGLADQGDYARMIGRFGYGPAQKSPADTIAFVPRKFVPDPTYRVRNYEHIESEYLFTGTAVLLNKLFSKDGSLDIEMIGLVHAIAFLAAFARLLVVTTGLRGAPLLWIAMLVVFTDVGYVAYWNSFYAEPASCIFFLFLAAETIAILRSPVVSNTAIVRWSLLAIFFVGAKSQNFPLAVLLAPLCMRLGSLRSLAIAGSVGITFAAAFNFATVPKPLTMANSYDTLFMAILPESKTPAADLASFHLDLSLLAYSGSGAWSPGTAFGQLAERGTLNHELTPASVARFWLLHPTRIWRRAKAVLPIAFSLRPEWCGNFERSAGRPPGARSSSFILWSWLHEHPITKFGKFLLVLLVLLPFEAIIAWIRLPRRHREIEVFAVLSTCCFMAFLVAICGDAWDNVKHLFLFNLLFDATLLSTLSCLLSVSYELQSRPRSIAPPPGT